MRERAPGAFVAVGPQDAQRLGMTEGDQVVAVWDGGELRARLVVREGLPAGIAGIGPRAALHGLAAGAVIKRA
jgi:anaerobic selenocysteine-containing dehydrogenase